MSQLINNSFNDKVIEESAKALFDLIYSEGKKIGKRVYDRIKVQTALKNYADNYLKRYGIIKVLGMAEPLPLKEIYTDVKIVSIDYLNKEKDINYLEQNFKIDRMFGTGSRKNGIDIANNVSKLNILGSPGSGKSTFLKRIGLEALVRKSTTNNNQVSYSHDCIPVFIELKRFKNEEIDVKSLIQNEFEIARFPESEYFLEKALEHGKLLILLDGLDEVPSQILNESIQHIKDFTNKYDKNRFITSCRTAFYKSYLTGFTDVEIASFDNMQIKSFINNWFNLEKDIAAGSMNRLIELLFDNDNKSSLELARTPLLLTFICLTFDNSLRFPANRSSLYRRALMILMEKWAAEKRIHNEDIYQDLNSDLELEMLAEVAAKFFEQGKTFFYRQELKSEILLFLNNTLNAKNIAFSKIIEAIEIQQGLLVQRAAEIYSFSHLTIQEYLTAHHYYSPYRLTELIEKRIFENRWREVFLLISGMPNADSFLQKMLDQVKFFAQSDSLIKETIEWIKTIIPDTDDFETDAYKRVFVSSLLLRFRRHDSDFNKKTVRLESYHIELLFALNKSFLRSHNLKNNINKKDAIKLLDLITNWNGKLTNLEISKKKINSLQPSMPLNKMVAGSRQKYFNEILEVFYEALLVPKDILLRRDKYKNLLQYIEALALIINCKNASLRISKDVWKRVCLSIIN